MLDKCVYKYVLVRFVVYDDNMLYVIVKYICDSLEDCSFWV